MFYYLEFAGVGLSIHAKTQSAVNLVEPAIEAMAYDKSDNPDSRSAIPLLLDGEDGCWNLSDQRSGLNLDLKQAGDVVYHLTDRIVFHVADKSQGVHCLHAAAVAHNGQAIVIPANSGAGKSTLTTWLAANGFDYLSDELILISDGGELQAIARPIQIKSHGLAPVLPLLKNSDAIARGVFANAIPISSLGSNYVQQAQSLGMFVFPQYQSGTSFELSKLSSADAGMRLMANHVNARNLDGHGFRAMMKLIRNTPCYSLDYGGFDTLPTDFSSQLKALLLS
jgi:hypothetical protein